MLAKDGERKYSPIRETDDENKMQSVDNSSEHYSQYEDSAEISNRKGGAKVNVRKPQDSMMSSNEGLSISASNPVMSKFSKQVAALMNDKKKKKDEKSYESDEEDEDEEDNNNKSDEDEDDDDDDDSDESSMNKKAGA
jgi:hypothetical protein